MIVGPLDGVSLSDLQSMLTAAQAARAALLSGARVASASYTQGSGSKSVTYQQADMAALLMWIGELQVAIGKLTGQRVRTRAPLRPLF